MKVRDADKLKAKVTVTLDGRHIGYLVFGVLVLSAVVFAAGFLFGQKMASAEQPPALAEVACLEVLDDAGATGSVPVREPDMAYEKDLQTEEPAASPDDPALRLLAEERDDLAILGTPPEPDDEMEEPPVVEPEEAVDTAVAIPNEPPAGEGRFTVQVQALKSLDAARSFALFLQDRGYEPFIQELERGDGTYHRIRIGRFATQSEATRFQRDFEKAEGMQTLVARLR